MIAFLPFFNKCKFFAVFMYGLRDSRSNMAFLNAMQKAATGGSGGGQRDSLLSEEHQSDGTHFTNYPSNSSQGGRCKLSSIKSVRPLK